MKCNACMSRSLSSTHVCREKCIEDKCPICHEDMFTSSDPIKALACGHLMHSSCFEVLEKTSPFSLFIQLRHMFKATEKIAGCYRVLVFKNRTDSFCGK